MSTAKPLTEPAIASQDAAADDSNACQPMGTAEMIGPEALHAIGELLRAASQHGLGVASSPTGRAGRSATSPASQCGRSISFLQASCRMRTTCTSRRRPR